MCDSKYISIYMLYIYIYNTDKIICAKDTWVFSVHVHMVTQHTQHMNSSYILKFSTNNCVWFLYINIYYELHMQNLVFYNCTFAWLSL
jgi:hypothetical protein